MTYYDPLNKSNHRFPFPKQNAIGNFEKQDAGEQGMFFLTPGGEILLFDRDVYKRQARDTYFYDPDALKFRSHTGWKQDNIWAACLGLTEEAKSLSLARCV